MRKEIIEVCKERNIIRISLVDERFYAIPSTEQTTGLPIYKFLPSCTYIASFYPKGKFFEEWLKKMGNEAEIIKQLAGEKGSKVHQAIALLIDGATISMQQALINPNTGETEELTVDEYEAIVSFGNWFKAVKPKVIAKDIVVVNEEIGYAGTLDLDCEIDNKPYIIDFKTSKEIWPSYELQVSAYKHTPKLENRKLAILRLGYTKNKNNYKFDEIEDKFELFKNVHQIFLNEVGDKKPRQIELPLSISL